MSEQPSNANIANGFKFCAHGGEYCHKCLCDYRKSNNTKIGKQLSQEFPGLSTEQLWGRPPLDDALKDASDAGTKDEEGNNVYRCKSHEAVDCNECFDWGGLVLKNIKSIFANYGKKIPTEATREEKLQMLASMGVELPLTTGLPEEDVDKKLRSAVDSAQYFFTLVPSKTLDPKSSPIWKRKLLRSAVARGSIEETRQEAFAQATLRQAPFPEHERVFMELRDTISGIAHGVDEGHKHFLIQDKDQDSALGLRVVEVRKVGDGVPVFVVLCGRGTRNSALNHVLDWTINAFGSRKRVGQITASVQEQNLLLTLLNLNSKRLVSHYKPVRGPFEQSFILSFILPLGPISQQDIGRLMRSSGCFVCGKKGDVVRECSGCALVEYCGRGCQRADWKEHKDACQLLSGGTWYTTKVDFETTLRRAPGGPGYTNTINVRDSLHAVPSPERASSSAPPNIHGDRPFLVKMQRPLNSHIGPIMIYDRERSFTFFLNHEDDADSYRKAQMEFGLEVRIYRWVKRTADSELSICFDRQPPKPPVW
ncbi:hypothetical protein VNI00_004158 [Paramarasmius palmivorus]|uniref:MYND-type domain-containing protein n=1 Tax=Paramarasmius palmivorus TaxID=297713 RepID=A0AAW0DNX9_9AGAR